MIKGMFPNEEVNPIPFGELQPGTATLNSNGAFNWLYLPVDSIYQVEAQKYEGFPFLKVFVTIPTGTGQVERINYTHLEGRRARCHPDLLPGGS